LEQIVLLLKLPNLNLKLISIQTHHMLSIGSVIT